ncbi:MAG: hypothetical protein A2W27_06115 [Deltaproteobacteria bacterium RBG_16_44_11]|nr:MAG: hypothetical protein A2W27_06115 [Deltaproteobacteria bacterium RBG_16_44_11]
MRNLLNIILTILKASSWGVLLFLIVCFVILEAWIAYLNISSIKPLSVMNEAFNTMLKINSNLSRLKAVSQPEDIRTRQGERWTLRDVLNEHESSSPQKYREYREKKIEVIKASLENDCPNCGLSLDSFYNPYMDNEIDIDHLKKTLERLSIKKNIITFNIIKYLSLLISSIAILLGIYLVSVLFSYKKITAQGMVVIFLLAVPIILILIALPGLTAALDFKKYLEFTFKSEESLKYLALLGIPIGYFFLIYPPIFLLCKNKKISIKKALFLQTCCGAPSE